MNGKPKKSAPNQALEWTLDLRLLSLPLQPAPVKRHSTYTLSISMKSFTQSLISGIANGVGFVLVLALLTWIIMSTQFEQRHGRVSTRSADDIANLSTNVKRISKSPSGRLNVLIEVTNNSANEVALVRLDGMLSYKSGPLTTCSGTLRTGTIRPSESGLALVDCRYEYPDIAVDELEADIYVEELSYVQKNG